MTAEDVLKDYRKDWLARCTAINNLDYSRFNGMKVYFSEYGSNNSLSDSISEIFSCIKTKYAPDLEILPLENNADENSVALVWDLKNIPVNRPVENTVNSLNCPVVYVTDCAGISSLDNSNFHILCCESVYGAGLDKSSAPSENNSTNILDFFAAQLFLLINYNEIPPDVYYCGHGNCNLQKAENISKYGYSPMISYDDGRYMYEFSKAYPNERFYFGNTYGGNLKLLHELLFKCLVEFDRICKKHDIKYFLGGGTLLGAVRHKGMIPWDDDMDVMMLRPDYDKFVSVVEQEITDGMFFQSNQTDKQYHSVFTKIRLDNTKFVTRFSCRFPEMHQGIFIDIFVHDHSSNNKIGQKLHVFETLFARSMVFHKWENTPMHFYGKLKFVCKLVTAFIRKNSFEKLEQIQDKVIQKYNKKNTKYLYDGTGEHLRHGAFPAKWLDKTAYLEFNGKMFPVPEKYHEYLQYSYGNYENWIPASLRKAGHDIIQVDFGTFKNK